VAARVALLAAVGALAGCSGSAAPAIHGAATRSRIQAWLTDAAPAAWDARTDRIIVNRQGPDGLWNAYAVSPAGRDPVCLTCARPSFPGVGTATNRGASDVSPDGRYVLLVVEKGTHPGAIGSVASAPGKGVDNDVWLATADGRRAWPLTDLPASPDVGVIWPRFDRTGSQVVWAQMYAAATLSHPLGQWTMKVARLQWSGGAPRLVAVRTYDPQPGRFYEPYGFSPDDRRILFASDVTVPSGFLSPSAFNTQIWTIDAAHLDDLARVSPPDPIRGPFSNYNEFAYYIPGTSRVLIARTLDAAARGMDYWTVAADGADPRRLTYMNQPGNPEYMGYSVAGGVAFDPHEGSRFVAGVAHNLLGTDIDSVFVSMR